MNDCHHYNQELALEKKFVSQGHRLVSRHRPTKVPKLLPFCLLPSIHCSMKFVTRMANLSPSTDGEFGGYLIVNNLMYCLEHELEVCGKCDVYHLATNFMHEYTRDNVVDVMEDWLDDMKRIGSPSRQAP